MQANIRSKMVNKAVSPAFMRIDNLTDMIVEHDQFVIHTYSSPML